MPEGLRKLKRRAVGAATEAYFGRRLGAQTSDFINGERLFGALAS